MRFVITGAWRELCETMEAAGYFDEGAIAACALPWLTSLPLQHASFIMYEEASLIALSSLYQDKEGTAFLLKVAGSTFARYFHRPSILLDQSPLLVKRLFNMIASKILVKSLRKRDEGHAEILSHGDKASSDSN
nr:hypothetical protein [Tanacetum cinerariifolium]